MQKPVPLLAWPDDAAAALCALQANAGLAVIGVQTAPTQDRSMPRQLVRQAVQDLLAQLWQRPAQSIAFSSLAGQPIRVLRGTDPMQLSFSHAPGLSVVALHQHDTVGVDILRMDSLQDGSAPLLSDWEQLAHGYLGPTAHQYVIASAPHQRTRAFAQQWCQWEAALKCLGQGVQEWSPRVQHALQACQAAPLQLPAAWASTFYGAVATHALAPPATGSLPAL